MFDYLSDGTCDAASRVMPPHLSMMTMMMTTHVNPIDHDRKRSQNWKSGAGKRLLLWDSGLAWLHGPETRTSLASQHHRLTVTRA